MPNSLKSIATNSGASSSIGNGGLTRDNTLGLSGTAGGKVKKVAIYDGSTFLGNATLKKNGSWSFNTSALADGTHNLTAKFFGKTTTSTSVVVTIDTRPPAATFSPTVLTNVGPQTSITSGQSTLDKTLGLKGTAEVGSKVAIYDGNTLLGNATVASNGTWSFTTQQLAPGQHALKAVVSDAAGNQTTVNGPTANLLAIGTVSATVGTDSGITPTISAGGATKDRTPTISGTAVAGTNVDIYDGNTRLGKAVVRSDGTWTFTTPELADGKHALKARFTTPNETYDAVVNVTVDNAPDDGLRFLNSVSSPGKVDVIDISSVLLMDKVAIQLFDFSGAVSFTDVVKVFDNGQLIGTAHSMYDSGYWSINTPTLAPGVHQFSAQVVDAAGNVAEVGGMTITTALAKVSDNMVTSTGATPTIANGGVTHDDTLGFSGAAMPGVQVSVFEGQRLLSRVTAGQDGAWSMVSPHLVEGTHNFRFEYAKGSVTQVDAHSLSATIDTTAPTGTFQTLPGASLSTPVLTGTAEAGVQVSLYDGNTVLGTPSRDGANWRYAVPALSQFGTHSFKARLVDAAGNETWVSGPSTNVLGSLDPAIVTDSGHAPSIQSGGITSDNTLTFTGTAVAGAAVRLYDGSTTLGTVSVASNGRWSLTTPTLADGQHNFHVDVTAGGQRASSADVRATVDHTPPTVVATLSSTLVTNLGDTPNIQSGGRTADHTLGLSGTAQANEYVKVLDGSTLLGTAPVDATGHWSFDTPGLSSGTHSFKAMVVDAAGNEGPAYSNTVSAQVNAAPALPAFNHPWSVESGWGEIDALAALRAATGRALPDVLDKPKLGGFYNDGVVLSNMEDAHYYGYTGAGVTVAVIDTGFSSDQQPALAQTKISPWTWDFANNDPVPEDVDTHGTFVASQIVARGDLTVDDWGYGGFVGGAYGVTLMPLRIGYNGDSTDLFQAVRYAVDHGADIINMSLFVGTGDVPGMRSAIQYAKDHDVLVVASAGNDTNGTIPLYPAAFAREFNNVLAVGIMEGHTYANWGNDAGAGPYGYVDASGINTLGYIPTGSMTWWHGSSFSTPLVTAEAALLQEANPLLSASQIADLITHTAHGVASRAVIPA